MEWGAAKTDLKFKDTILFKLIISQTFKNTQKSGQKAPLN